MEHGSDGKQVVGDDKSNCDKTGADDSNHQQTNNTLEKIVAGTRRSIIRAFFGTYVKWSQN